MPSRFFFSQLFVLIHNIILSSLSPAITNIVRRYLTAAAAIGMRDDEIDVFVDRLDKAFVEFGKKLDKAASKRSKAKNTDAGGGDGGGHGDGGGDGGGGGGGDGDGRGDGRPS